MAACEYSADPERAVAGFSGAATRSSDRSGAAPERIRGRGRRAPRPRARLPDPRDRRYQIRPQPDTTTGPEGSDSALAEAPRSARHCDGDHTLVVAAERRRGRVNEVQQPSVTPFGPAELDAGGIRRSNGSNAGAPDVPPDGIDQHVVNRPSSRARGTGRCGATRAIRSPAARDRSDRHRVPDRGGRYRRHHRTVTPGPRSRSSATSGTSSRGIALDTMLLRRACRRRGVGVRTTAGAGNAWGRGTVSSSAKRCGRYRRVRSLKSTSVTSLAPRSQRPTKRVGAPGA
jgi:hypothetical protein